MEGVSVYEARKRIGHLLAEKFPIQRPTWLSLCLTRQDQRLLAMPRDWEYPLKRGFLKIRYSKRGSMRSFIEPYQASQASDKQSITPIRNIIEGKNVVIIDDSIVRGTSSTSIIETIRRAGSNEN